MSQQTMTTADGRLWRTSDYLGYSDYSGGTVERSNVRVLSEGRTIEQFPYGRHGHGGSWSDAGGGVFAPVQMAAVFPYAWEPVTIAPETDALEFYGGHGTTELWLLDSEETRGALDALDDYPCADDDDLSALETEAETEALADAYKDLARKADWGRYPRLHDYLNDLPADAAYEAYREACEATNTYPQYETGGSCYIDIDRLWPVYVRVALSRRHGAV